MNDNWRQLSLVMKVALAVAFFATSVSVIGSLFLRHWSTAIYVSGPFLVIAWSFGPMEMLRAQTTERLSRAQTLALSLLALVGYWGWRFVVADDGSVYVGVGMVGLVIWLARTVMAEGWSRRSD